MVKGKCYPSVYDCTEPNEHRIRMTELINDTIDDCIPYIEKVAYLMAREKSQHLIEIETNPIQFLMYEKWNIWSAAQRIVKYWEWKCTLFGNERTYLSIFDISGTNGSLNDTEILYLKSGCLALLPKDTNGNCYLFINRYRFQSDLSLIEMIPKLRLVFYILCLAVHDYYEGHSNDIINDNDSDNQTGLVIINLVLSIAPSATRNLKDLIVESFPIRIIKNHTIFFHTKSNMFSLDQYIIPSYISINVPLISFSNLIIYYCRTETEAVSKLHQRGVPLECIPSILGGLWTYNSFDDWFEKTYQYWSNFLNINNETQVVPPDMVEESVVLSDIVHLFHSGICDSTRCPDESSDSAPIIDVFENREESDVNNAQVNTFQTSSIRETGLNHASISLLGGAMTSQTIHHYQMQAIDSTKPCNIGPTSCDSFCDSVEVGTAESNSPFPKQLEIMSKISSDRINFEATLQSGAFMILPKNKMGQYVLSYEPVKAISESFESHCLCFSYCLKYIHDEASTRDNNGCISLVMIVFLDQEFLESKLVLDYNTFIDVLDSFPMIQYEYIHYFLEPFRLGWYAYQDIAKCVAAQLFKHQADDKSEFHVLPSNDDSEKDGIEENIVESFCYHFGFEKHNLPTRLEDSWNELPILTI